MISKNLPSEIRQIWKEIERLRARVGGHFVADSVARAIIWIENGTAPTTSPADSTQLYSADLAAGNAGLHIRSETGAIHKFGSYTVLPGVIRPASDSTTALQLATAGGTGIVIVDTTNSRLVLADGVNVQLGTSTGTKFGVGTTEKLAFHGATPIAQRSHVADPSGGATVDAEARTAINSILATLEAYGFHATS